jgi:hypothetical protein
VTSKLAKKQNQKKKGVEPKGSGSKKTMRVAIISLVAVLIVAGGVLVYVLTRDNTPDEPRGPDGGRGFVLTPANADQFNAERGDRLPDSHFRVVMNNDWHFDTWNSPSENAYVENSSDNSRTVYIDVILRDSGELVYSSPYIPLGNSLFGFALDRPVPAGEHQATVIYRLVDDDFAEVTTLSVTVRLVISQ